MPGTVGGDNTLRFAGADARDRRYSMEFGDRDRTGGWFPTVDIGIPHLVAGQVESRGIDLEQIRIALGSLAMLGTLQSRSATENRVRIAGLDGTLDMLLDGQDAEFKFVFTRSPVGVGNDLVLPFDVTLPRGAKVVRQTEFINPSRPDVNGIITSTSEAIGNDCRRHIRMDGGFVVKGNYWGDRDASARGRAIHASTGKLGDLPRMVARDAAGATLWSTLTFVAGELRHTWSGAWFRDAARVYPIRISDYQNATFGKTDIGASTFGWAVNQARYTGIQTLIEDGTVTLVNDYQGDTDTIDITLGIGSGTPDPTTIEADGPGGAIPASPQWYARSVSYAFTSSENLWLVRARGGGATLTSNYDVVTQPPHMESDGISYSSGTIPAPSGLSDIGQLELSLYATYTPAAGGPITGRHYPRGVMRGELRGVA